MNKQQAINILKNIEQSLDDYCGLNDEAKTAFRMAITALELFGNSEQLPSVQPKIEERTAESAQNVLDGDLISRQAAIEALYREIIKRRLLDEMYDGALDEFQTEEILKKVSPAQPEPLHINLNEWVKVKLTDLGKEIYYHQYDELNKAYGMEVLKPYFPSEDEDGYTRFQLWKFTQLYGAHIGMGAPNVIDPLEIVYEVEINARTD